MKKLSLIPNLITLGNLMCGFIAIILGLSGFPGYAAIFVLFGALLDLFDGLSARLLNAKSAIGAQLDSLADIVTFGVAPAVILCGFSMVLVHEDISEYIHVYLNGDDLSWLRGRSSLDGLDQLIYGKSHHTLNHIYTWGMHLRTDHILIISMCMMIPAFGAYRLARYNVTPSSNDFKGLPIPAFGIFVSSTVLFMDHEITNQVNRFEVLFEDPIIIAGLCFLLAVLMVTKIPMFSLKLKSFRWLDSKIQYFFLGLCIVSIIFAVLIKNIWISFPLIILLYITLSLINNLTGRNEV